MCRLQTGQPRWLGMSRAARAAPDPHSWPCSSGSPFEPRCCPYVAQHYSAARFTHRHCHPLTCACPCSISAGAFTNQIQKGFEEPRLLIVTDPRTDHQSIKEAAYMNIPVIAFCDTDSDLQVRSALWVAWVWAVFVACCRLQVGRQIALPAWGPWNVAPAVGCISWQQCALVSGAPGRAMAGSR